MYDAGHSEDGFETDSFLSNISSTFVGARLCTISNAANRYDICFCEASFVAVNTQTTWSIGEIQFWHIGLKIVVLCVLDELPQKMSCLAVELLGETDEVSKSNMKIKMTCTFEGSYQWYPIWSR